MPIQNDGKSNMLVTGGLGFIGSHFIRKVLSKGYGDNNNSNNDNSLVVNIDFMGYGSNVDNLKDVLGISASADNDNNSEVAKKNYRYIKANITDRQAIESLASIGDIDVIVNFAAETHVDRSISNPTAFVDSNINGTVSLLEFCRLHDIPLFIQISTDEVYGDIAEGVRVQEDSPLRPNSPYSASKASADLLTMAYNKTYGLRTIITRCSNNFGPYQFPEKLIPKAITRTLRGLSVPIYGDGTQTREWIYVNDHVDAILKVIINGRPGEIYNITSSREISNIELIGKIRNILHDNIKSDIKLQVQHVQDRPGHDGRYSMDCSKIKRELGWEPTHSFDFALRQTIKWYIDNEWWWAPLLTQEILGPPTWQSK